MGMLNRLFGGSDTQDQTEAILARHLDRDFTVSPMAATKQTRQQLQELSSKLAITYPPEFIAHVCGAFPGIFVEVKEAIWPRSKEYDIGPFWSFLYAVHTFTPATDSEPWMRLEHVATKIRL